MLHENQTFKKVWFHERFLFLDRMTGIILNSDCYWQVVRVMLCTIFDCRCNVIQGWYLKSLPYFFLGIQFIFILFAKHSNMDCSVLCLSTFSRYFSVTEPFFYIKMPQWTWKSFVHVRFIRIVTTYLLWFSINIDSN